MKLDEEILRYTIGTLFAAAGATVMVYLWYLDQILYQREFGALLSGGLVIFSMAIYVYSKEKLTGRTNTWLLLGCLGASVLLLMAIQLGST